MASPNPALEPAEKPHSTHRVSVTPDRELVRRLLASGGDAMRQCVQCATCSAVCDLTSDHAPLPRKEMLWAQWGLKDRIVADVDLWLCHECHDCTLRCPRGARPGDVMAALRQQCVIHYSVPRFFARGAGRPVHLPWFILGSMLLLVAGISLWDATGAAATELATASPRIVMPFWPRLPHGLITTLFAAVALFDIVVLGLALRRFARALRLTLSSELGNVPSGGWSASIRAVVQRIVWHDDFDRCGKRGQRRTSHSLVVYGMLGLLVVDFWVITARYNPLRVGLVYPLGLLDPWKVLANLAGVLLLSGCATMCYDRLRRPGCPFAETQSSPSHPSGTYSDWLLLVLLMAVVISGFVTEALHFVRLDTPRIVAYLVHLVLALTLLLLVPYSKLAHLGYRTVALVFAERFGRRSPRPTLAIDRREVS
jgi:quinone-modifying oxidoreductase, subunit QmoC